MRTALIVDDSEYMRTLIKVCLKKHDFQDFYDADNGKTGVEKYKEIKPDIVFLDIIMEEMDGMEALKQIMAFDPDANVIMISSVIEQAAVVEEVKALGARDVMVKPPNNMRVAEILESIFGG